MSVTLRWLLDRPALSLEYLEGPDPADVEVRWAHSVELADPTPWLEGGELVLTTGLRLPRSIAGLTAYVQRLSDAGVAAIGFGIGLEHAEVPRAMRKACATAGLPLVVVPLPTPFLAIVRAIADHSAEEQRSALQDAFAFQQQLTRAALERGVPGLVHALADKLDAAVVVLDGLGPVVASANAGPALLERVRREAGDDDGPPARTLPTDGEGALMLLRLSDGRQVRGRLALETTRPATTQERLLVGQVASMLTLQLTRSADLSALYAEVGGAAADLALGEAADPALARFGLGGAEGLRVVVAASVRDRVVRPDELTDALEALRRPHVCTAVEGRAVALVPGDVDDAALARVRRDLDDRGRRDVVLGASAAQPLAGVRTGLAEATRAAATARMTNEPVVVYRGLELDALLDDGHVRGLVADLAGSRLSMLLDSPRPAHRDLVRTLRAFLETNGSWETASRRLGVHRHTLRQRVTRVEAETGLDLDSAQTRAATLLVLLAHDRDG